MQQHPVFIYGSCTQLGCSCASYEETNVHQCLCLHMKNYHAKYVLSGGVLIPIPTSVQPVSTTTPSLYNISSEPLSLSQCAQDYTSPLNEASSSLLNFKQNFQATLNETSNYSLFGNELLNQNHTENIINSPLSISNDDEMTDHFGDSEDNIRIAAETLFNFIKALESCDRIFLTSSDLNSFYLNYPDIKDKIKEAGGLKSLIFKFHWNFTFLIDQEKKKEMITTKTVQFKGNSKIPYENIINENYEMYMLANELLEDFIKRYGEEDGKVIRADRDILVFYTTHPEIQDLFRKFGGLVAFCFSRKGSFFPFQDFRSKLPYVRLARAPSNLDTENGTKSINRNDADVDLINDVYSTKLDISAFSREQILRAERIAKEIEKNGDGNGNIHNIIAAPEDLDVSSNKNLLRISHIMVDCIKGFGDKMRVDTGLGQIYELNPDIKLAIKDVGGISAFCALFPKVLKIEIDDGMRYLSIADCHKNGDCSSENDGWELQKRQKTNKKEFLKIAESLFLYISQKENKKLREKDLPKFYSFNPNAKKAIDEIGGIINFCEVNRHLFRKPVVDLQNGGLLILIRNK